MEFNKETYRGEVVGTSVENINFYPTFNNTYNEDLSIAPLRVSDYSNQFNNICSIITKYYDIKCYN
ncbi:MAG: hypothetical protein ACK5G7_01065 [Erysipelotrichaceae bacterium]